MSAAPAARLVDALKLQLSVERLSERPDDELLARVVARDEAAFEAIVRRHGPLVLTAARAVLGDDTEVDDVFQTTFIALWRGGKRIRKAASLGCWLFGVARRASLKAHSLAKRRREIESHVPDRNEVEVPDLSWREACQLLHDEIERLPATFRAPMVLCHLQGQSRDEAARALGCNVDTLRGRLERGREMLKRRLTRRGVTLSAGLLATLTGEPASAALVAATIAAARACAMDGARSLLPRGLALAALVVISVGLLVGFTKRTGDALPEKLAVEALKVVLKGRVVDAKGQPIAGAKLDAIRWNIGRHVQATTDKDGRYSLELVGGKSNVGDEHGRLVVAAEGFAPAAVRFGPTGGEVNVELGDPVPLEGRILTLEGQPVAGASVRVKAITVFESGGLDRLLKAMVRHGRRDPPVDGPDGVYLIYEGYETYLFDHFGAARTDREGRFRIPAIGANRLVDLVVSGPTIHHAELVARTQIGSDIRIHHRDEEDRFTVLPSPFDYLAKPTQLLRGIVRDKSNGRPIAGAKVTSEGTATTATTDAAGRYELAECAKGATYKVTATPPKTGDFFITERVIADTAASIWPPSSISPPHSPANC